MLHERGVHRVEAMTDVANVPEQRALARAGFKLEGIARGAQVWVDMNCSRSYIGRVCGS